MPLHCTTADQMISRLLSVNVLLWKFNYQQKKTSRKIFRTFPEKKEIFWKLLSHHFALVCFVVVVMCCCYCRSWVMFHWRCWRWCWYGRSCCYTWTTVTLMTTVNHASDLASPAVLSAERTPRWCQYVGTGVWPWLAGRSRQPVCGSSTK